MLSSFPSWSAPSRCEFVSVHAQEGEISLILFGFSLQGWVGGLFRHLSQGSPLKWPLPIFISAGFVYTLPNISLSLPGKDNLSLSLQLLILFQRFYAQSRGLVMAFLLKFQCCPSFSIIRSLCCLSSRF